MIGRLSEKAPTTDSCLQTIVSENKPLTGKMISCPSEHRLGGSIQTDCASEVDRIDRKRRRVVAVSPRMKLCRMAENRCRTRENEHRAVRNLNARQIVEPSPVAETNRFSSDGENVRVMSVSELEAEWDSIAVGSRLQIEDVLQCHSVRQLAIYPNRLMAEDKPEHLFVLRCPNCGSEYVFCFITISHLP